MKENIREFGSMLYSRKDLLYEYSWAAYDHNDPRVSGVPGSTLFDKSQGREMLYIINAFAQQRGFRSRSSCCKLEKIIHLFMPSSVRRQDEAIRWIEDNWFNFM